MKMKVVTYQSPANNSINICKKCEGRLSGNWPKDNKGQEYCAVSYGLHTGTCGICQAQR